MKSKLLLNLQNDWTFKNVFLNECSLDFLCFFFSYLLGYNKEDLRQNITIIGGEIPTNIEGHNNGHTDIMFTAVCLLIARSTVARLGNKPGLGTDYRAFCIFIFDSS